MSHVYMLDTNIVSELMRNPKGKVYQRIKQEGESTICTSIIVAAELRFGAQKKQFALLSERLENILTSMVVMAFDEPADQSYGLIRQQLQQQGQLIGPNDLLIAAHALSLNLVLVTNNVDEFEWMQGLQVEAWL